MLEKIKALLSQSRESPRFTEFLPDEQVSVCAILLEVAEADRNFAPEEFKEIIVQLRAYFGLGRKQVDELMEVTEAERKKSTDLWPFTNYISRGFSPRKKQEVLTMVWQVIFADLHLDPYEDQLAHRLKSMLSVNQSVLMAAKKKAREIISARTGLEE